jgi:hypothetical protein
MVKITDGTNTKEVTKGMFDNLYSHMGYRLIEKQNESKPVQEKPKEVKPEVKDVEDKQVQKENKEHEVSSKK